MPKRAATSELNHFNWNQEEEPEDEECAAPKIASPEVMSKRIIKTGKRRISGSTNTTNDKSVFSSFTGFGNSPSNSDLKATFGFLSNKTTLSNANGITIQKVKTHDNENENNCNKTNDTEYLAKLKGLNETLLEWIKIHVGKNPTCILSPIFNDYDKYLKEIQSPKHLKDKKVENVETSVNTVPYFSGTAKPFFNNNLFKTNNENEKDTTKKEMIPSEESSSSIMPGLNPLQFKGASTEFKSSIFSKPEGSPESTVRFMLGDGKMFGSSKPFSTGIVPTVVASTQDDDTDNKDEEPPKNVFAPVTEEGAVFSQRIKLFLKKNDNYVDNGVGTLYIKPVDKDCTRYQAIVRADTNLGNILLNTILKDSLPSKRMGKNNVMIVCILEVDKEFKSVPVLLRVKTETEADHLLEQINKYKKPSQ